MFEAHKLRIFGVTKPFVGRDARFIIVSGKENVNTFFQKNNLAKEDLRFSLVFSRMLLFSQTQFSKTNGCETGKKRLK